MDIANLLTEDSVILRGGVSSKRQALHLVAETGAKILGVTAPRLFAALLEREALGSTGLGGGVAVPHARLDGLPRVAGVFVRIAKPVPFGAVDDRPVDLLFALFAPPADETDYLRALAAISRTLRSPQMREHLRQARTVDSVRALFVRDHLPAAAA